MTEPALNPLAPHSLPWFVTPPGATDMLSVFAGGFLLVAILGVGVLYLKIHSLPERSAHAGRKVQFEIVAILGLLSLLTHNHIFWVAGLLLAFIDIPDLSGPLRSMARSLGKMAGRDTGDEVDGPEPHPPEPHVPERLPATPHTTALPATPSAAPTVEARDA